MKEITERLEQGVKDIFKKFFRENLLDEADPKVVNPERKKLNISTRVWAIAFFVLLALFSAASRSVATLSLPPLHEATYFGRVIDQTPSSSLSTLHGLPTATTFDGISVATILPAPMTVLSPIVTPGSIVTPAPIQQFLPIVIGALY